MSRASEQRLIREWRALAAAQPHAAASLDNEMRLLQTRFLTHPGRTAEAEVRRMLAAVRAADQAEVRSSATRRVAVKNAVDAMIGWAQQHQDVLALVLVGSWATDQATLASDLDFIVCCENPQTHLDDPSWMDALDAQEILAARERGALVECRARGADDLEVELVFARPEWLAVPVGEQTARVLRKGFLPLYDPHRRLRAAAESLGLLND